MTAVAKSTSCADLFSGFFYLSKFK